MEITKWLTPQLEGEIRALYEVKINKKLSKEEVCEIANNLADFFEHLLKFKFREEIQNVR